MKTRARQSHIWLLLGALGAAALSQCLLIPESDRETTRTAPNLRPIAEITTGLVADSVATGPVVRFRWHGADRDGVIRWFEWALDDTVTESAWHRTTDFEITLPMRVFEQAGPTTYSGWHAFFLRARDAEGLISVPDRRYFNAHTIAPRSWLVAPSPRDGSKLATTLTFSWDGEDLDSQDENHAPRFYEYKLVHFLHPITPQKLITGLADSLNVLSEQLHDPRDFPADSLGDYFHRARAAWIRVAGSQKSVFVDDLSLTGDYCFAVRAIDESGAVEPDVVSGRNRIVFYAGNNRIHMTLCEPGFGCQVYNNATFGKVWKLTVSPGQEIRFNWQGDASATGTQTGLSSYGFDLVDPDDDDFIDINGQGGWIGWAKWTQMREPISFPISDAGKTHLFYLKMRDITHLPETESRCMVEIYVARMTFSRKVLIVDDLYFAPKPCIGGPPRDADSDQLRLDLVGDALHDYLGPHDAWTEFSTFGSETSGVVVSLPDVFLEVIGAHQLTVWDCGSAQTTGLQESIRKRFLSRYVEAGGSLLMWCDQGPATILTNFQHVDTHPACPGTDRTNDMWPVGSGFLWNQLHLRGCIEKPRAPSGSVWEMAPQSMVRAHAENPLYPDLVLSPIRWDCHGRERGSVRFEGLTRNEDEPLGDPWYEREELAGGLEVLYRSATLDSGSLTDSLPVAWRTPASWADSDDNHLPGRIVFFAFHPYYFDERNLGTAMTYAIHWLTRGTE